MIGAGADTRFPHRHHRQRHERGRARRTWRSSRPTGVVGRVVTPTPHAVEGAAADRSQRRCRRAGRTHHGRRASWWAPAKSCCGWNYVSGVADVKVGDTIVTSGIDGIYPKGLLRSALSKPSIRERHLQGRYACGRPSDSTGWKRCWSSRRRPSQATALEDTRVRAAGTALMITVALALQTTLGRFLTPRRAARRPGFRCGRVHRAHCGPGPGLIAGAIAGLRRTPWRPLECPLSPLARRLTRRGASSAWAGWRRPLWVPDGHHRFAIHRRQADSAGAGILHSDGRPCDHISGALRRPRPWLRLQALRDHLQPGGRQRVSRRAGLPGGRFASRVRGQPPHVWRRR